MRRSRPRLAFPRRHEVSGGGHAVHREGQGSAAPALLGGAEESLPDGYLACDLPGLAVGDALAVACAVRGCGGDGAARAHPRRAAPVRGDVFHCEGPSGLRRLPCFGREEGCCDAYNTYSRGNGGLLIADVHPKSSHNHTLTQPHKSLGPLCLEHSAPTTYRDPDLRTRQGAPVQGCRGISR